jgi:hypothetical protein
MKKIRRLIRSLLLLSSLYYFQPVMAQIANYVRNGGFEQRSACAGPDLGYLEPYVYGWDEIDADKAAKWDHYCYGAVPMNGFFYNYPRTDSAYATYDVYCLTCAPHLRRTNIRNTLKSPLVNGKVYCVKFHINNSEYSSYSIDAFNAYFGGAEIDTITQAHVALSYLTPQINNPISNFLTDTIGWTVVAGTFTATGGEKYMVIGNLRSDAATNTIISNPSNTVQQYCTIAIDDVSCIPIDLPAFAGRDTTVLPSASVYLGRARDVGIDEDCQWYKLPIVITATTPAIDTAAGIWVNPALTSSYVVRQKICGIIKWDTVIVTVSSAGLHEESNFDQFIEIFPTPAQGEFYIRLKNYEETVQITISDIDGSVLQSISTKLSRTPVKVPVDLSDGMYFVSITNENNQKLIRKLIIDRK